MYYLNCARPRVIIYDIGYILHPSIEHFHNIPFFSSEVDSHIFKTEFLEIQSAYKHNMSIYTDGSKQDEKVACAVISPNFTDSIRLPDNSSIFTAEAKAIDIALYHIRDQPEKQFIIYSDSLSVLRSLKI